jgi:hypothetical protein
MIDSAARAALIAALEDISVAHSGRIRYHAVPRASAAATYGLDHLNINGDSDLAFDNDQSSISYRAESGAEVTRESVVDNTHIVSEKRYFLSKGLVYDRTLMAASDNDQDDDGQADELQSWDSSDASDADLWTVLSSEIMGIDLSKQAPPAQIHFAWLIAALSDPACEIDLDAEVSGQALYVTSVRADQLADGWEEIGRQYSPQARFGLRLGLDGGKLIRFVLETPPDMIEGVADLYDAFEQTYWRINEPVAIVEPTSAECRPEIPPIHTTIAERHLRESDRYLSFQWGGRECTDRFFWNDEAQRPYVPLAVGDKLRVTGSTRPYFRAKSNKAITATVWSAFTADEQTVLDARPPDREAVNRRALSYYDRVTDIVDQVVVLNDVAVSDEPMWIRFAAPIRAQGDAFEAVWEVSRPIAVSLGLDDGIALVVRVIDSSLGRTITRVSREDGTPVPGVRKLIGRETA